MDADRTAQANAEKDGPGAQNGQSGPQEGTASSIVRILIADEQAVFRMGLARLFSVEPDLTVVGETDSASEIVSKTLELSPDLLFAETGMFVATEADTLNVIRHASPSSKVVATAIAVDDAEVMSLIKAGARGVILKTAPPALFIKCARKVSAGEIWLPNRQVAAMASELSGLAGSVRPVDTLTSRERLVISCLVQGWRNREIASHLAITEQTVKNHLRSIYDKVGVSDRVELVLYVIHQHLELPDVKSA
jgi:DNA-binding NarL/FixJ family response regulator